MSFKKERPDSEFRFGLRVGIYNRELRERRAALHLTQKGLAEKVSKIIKCSSSRIGMIETLREYPPEEIRLAIAIILKVPEEILFPPSLQYYKRNKSDPAVIDIEIPMSQLELGSGKEKVLQLVSDTSVGDALEAESLKNELREILDELPHREKRVIELRFGINDEDRKTLVEVAAIFGVTPERIRQIENKALFHLRHPKRSQRLRDYAIITPTCSTIQHLISRCCNGSILKTAFPDKRNTYTCTSCYREIDIRDEYQVIRHQ